MPETIAYMLAAFGAGASLTALCTFLGTRLGMRDWKRRIDAIEREYRQER